MDISARYGWRCGGEWCLRELREQKDNVWKERKGKGLMFAGGRGRLVRLWYARVASRTLARQSSSRA